MPTVEAVTSWLEVACAVLLVAAAGAAGWMYAPALGFAASAATCAVMSAGMNALAGMRGRK